MEGFISSGLPILDGLEDLTEFLKFGDENPVPPIKQQKAPSRKKGGRKAATPKKVLSKLAVGLIESEPEKIVPPAEIVSHILAGNKIHGEIEPAPALSTKRPTPKKRKLSAKFLSGPASSAALGGLGVVKEFNVKEMLDRVIGQDILNKRKYAIGLMVDCAEYKVVPSGGFEPVLANFRFVSSAKKKDESIFYHAVNMVANPSLAALCESGSLDQISDGELFISIQNTGLEPFVSYPGMKLCKTEFYYEHN